MYSDLHISINHLEIEIKAEAPQTQEGKENDSKAEEHWVVQS